MTYYSALHYAAKAEAAATTATTLLPYLTDITTVATNIASVNTIATDISSITTAATNISSINTVATDISNVNDVAADLTNINAVAADLTNIDNASQYAAEAKQWAIGDPSEPVDGSAKYWAQQAAGQVIPSQTGHSGEYLTTDGSSMSWNAVDALPSQAGQSGKYLTTDGTDASWATLSVNPDNKSITTNASDQLQAIGVINQNDTTTALKSWTGTKAQYDAIVTKDANTLYNITDEISQVEIDLNGKANTDLSNVIANIDYVVESKFPTAEDPSWYRVYKSGWVEQGGECVLAQQSANTIQTATFILPKEMENTYYSATGIRLTDGGETSELTEIAVNKTTTTCGIVYWSNLATLGASIVTVEVKGMGANQ